MKDMTQKRRTTNLSFRRGLLKTLIAGVVALQLVACGGGGGGGTTSGSGGAILAASSAGTGSLTLSWVAPVARADGTPLSLSEIDGFRIYYGDSAGNYTHSVDITDATAQRVILNNLASGIYYIVMTTYDVDGRESAYSAVVRKTAS
jgi:hypothetical protein